MALPFRKELSGMPCTCLRYGWTPPNLLLHCPCGEAFGPDHALSCGAGGNTIMRHNKDCDLTASLLSEVYGNVQTEPNPVPLFL